MKKTLECSTLVSQSCGTEKYGTILLMDNNCQYLLDEYYKIRKSLPRDFEVINDDITHEIIKIVRQVRATCHVNAFTEALISTAEQSEGNKEYFLAKRDLEWALAATKRSARYTTRYNEELYWKYVRFLLRAGQSSPDSHFAHRFLFDVASNAYILANNENLILSARNTLKKIRESFKDSNYFPLVTETGRWGYFQENVWKDFCIGRETLYHAVPEKFCEGFKNGRLGFRSLRSLRSKEHEHSSEDDCEGVSFGSAYRGGEKTKIITKSESFIFCLTKSKDVARKRGGVLYKVNMHKFMKNLSDCVRGRQGCEWMNMFGIKYYNSNTLYKNKSFRVDMVAADVIYRNQNSPIFASPLTKRPHFAFEKEIRIMLSPGPDLRTAMRNKESVFQHLIGDSMAFVDVPNSDEWLEEIK